MDTYVILLGPPGSGKGTQAAVLAQRLGLAHVSSGDLFREAVASGSELGRQLDAIMRSGELVPDEITVQIVLERLLQPDAAHGAVLDGFPRTVQQSVALERALGALGKSLSQAILLDVPEPVLIRRLSSRWISRKTGRSYNVDTLHHSLDAIRQSLDPGDELYQRPDDRPETARRRIEVYREQTMPLVEHYRRLGILHTVDGDRPVDDVQADLVRLIAPRSRVVSRAATAASAGEL